MKTKKQGIPAAAFMAAFSSAGRVMNTPFENFYKNETSQEHLERDEQHARSEEQRYQRELHADASDYVEANSVEVPEPKRKAAGNWTTQMNLFDEEVA